MFVELCVVFCILLYFAWRKLVVQLPKTYPPGPFRVPIVGNLPWIGIEPLATLTEWRQKYGNVLGLRFGNYNIVMLSEYHVVKDAFSLYEFSGRPKFEPFKLIGGEYRRGLLVSEGPGWTEQRRFAMRNLRDLGFGSKSLDVVIQEEVTEFIGCIHKENGLPVSTQRYLSFVVLRTLWTMVTGERLQDYDYDFQSVWNTMNAVTSVNAISNPIFFLPWVAKLAPKLTGWNAYKKAAEEGRKIMAKAILEHRRSYNRKDSAKDLTDVYLNEIRGTVDRNSSFFEDAGEENMIISLTNIMAAGAETTSNQLDWAFYFLGKYPEVQKKVYDEIISVVGDSRLPNMDDRGLMIYTEATMYEIFRKSSIVPLGIYHSAIEDVIFHGYAIPKGTALVANLYEVHHDKETWGDPEEFRPERFISSDGQRLENTEKVIPFLVGKRTCIGETMARTIFYLFITSTLQTFHIQFRDGKAPDLESEMNYGVYRSPPLFHIIFQDRKTQNEIERVLQAKKAARRAAAAAARAAAAAKAANASANNTNNPVASSAVTSTTNNPVA